MSVRGRDGGIRGFRRRFCRDISGAAAILVALLLIPMIGAMGLAVDSAIAYMVRSRL